MINFKGGGIICSAQRKTISRDEIVGACVDISRKLLAKYPVTDAKT